MTEFMSIYQRIWKAQRIIADFKFQKSDKVAGSGPSYTFIPIDQILQIVRKAHSEAGIFITTGALEYDKENGEGVFVGDSRWTKARGHCSVYFNGADGDSFETVVPFNVQDNSDKLDNKILTNIMRQAYREIYAIDEGSASDPEATWSEDKVVVEPKRIDDRFFKVPVTKTMEQSEKEAKIRDMNAMKRKKELLDTISTYLVDPKTSKAALGIISEVRAEINLGDDVPIDRLNSDVLKVILERIHREVL